MSADDNDDRAKGISGADEDLDKLAAEGKDDSGSAAVASSQTLSSGQKEQDDLQLLLGLGGVFSTIAEANPARLAFTPAPPPAVTEWEINAADLETPVISEAQAEPLPAADDANESDSSAINNYWQTPEATQSEASVQSTESSTAVEGANAILRNSRLFSKPAASAPTQAANIWSFDEPSPPADLEQLPAAAAENAGTQPQLDELKVLPAVSEPPPEILAELQMEATAAWFEPAPPELLPVSSEPLEPPTANLDAIAETAEHIRKSMAESKEVLPLSQPAAALPSGLPVASVSNAMEGLVVKLNEQVKKATSKLVSQIEQTQLNLEAEIKTLTGKSHKAEQKDEGAFQSALSKMVKTLEETSEQGKVSLSDSAANGRYTIKQLLEGNQSTIAQQEIQSLESLLKSCSALASGAEALLSSTANEVDVFTRQRKAELNDLIESLLSRINSSRQEHLGGLQDRFERLKSRVSAETDLKSSSFEQMVESLSEDLGLVGQRASEKLKLAHNDLENDLKQAVRIFQLEISLLVKSLSNMQLAPKVHQHNTVLQETRQQLQSKFSFDLSKRTARQEAEFETAYTDAKLKQKEQEKEALQLLEEQINQRQVKITETFNDCRTYVCESEAECKETMQSLEEDIESSTTRSRKLIESSGTAPNADLITVRDTVVKSIRQGQKQASQELLSVIETHCQNLEQTSKSEQAKLIGLREKNSQDIADLAKQALEKIESEIHEAFTSIQLSQQKHLE